MKRYDKYKPSGIDWIGEVPEMWKIERLKFLFSHSNAGVWGDDEKGNKDDIVCFRVADFNYEKGCLFLEDNTIRNIDEKSLKGRLIKQNDLLIEKSGGGDNAPVGRVVKVNTDIRATCSNFIHFLTVDKYNDAAFLFYYFKFLYANKINLLFFNQTTGIQNLKLSAYLGQMAFMPSLPEQTAIAAYLDAKCSKIDNVVAIQQKRIELLKELKQSIITRAVTKGLNKNAKMKDSGVEWIGEMPEKWEVKRIKFIAKQNENSIKIGPFGSALTGKVIENGDCKVYGQWNIIDNDFSAGNSSISRDTYNELIAYKVYPKDILISMMGTVGKCSIIPNDIQDGIMDSHVVKIRLEPKMMDSNYFEYVYDKDNSLIVYEQIQKSKKGSIMDGLNSSLIKDFIIPVPPLPEQTAIAAYLDKKCAAIDSQIAKVEKQIELLNEYKQSVITECVTGKRKVC